MDGSADTRGDFCDIQPKGLRDPNKRYTEPQHIAFVRILKPFLPSKCVREKCNQNFWVIAFHFAHTQFKFSLQIVHTASINIYENWNLKRSSRVQTFGQKSTNFQLASKLEINLVISEIQFLCEKKFLIYFDFPKMFKAHQQTFIYFSLSYKNYLPCRLATETFINERNVALCMRY